MKQTHLEIVLQENLQAHWTEWFAGLQLELLSGGGTRLSGAVTDQSALFGLLERIRDLNLHLVSVQVRPE